MCHRSSLMVAGVWLAATALVAAPSLDVRPSAAPPKIDGVLRPGEWDSAAHSDAFRQITPLENAAPTERTEFWVTFDADTIYVAVRSHDAAGSAGLRAYSMQHDQDNGSDDIVRIVFDTFHRENDGYYFALTAAGGRHEGLIQNKAEANEQWDAIWFGKTSLDAGGWSAEFAIPLKSLAFDPQIDTWGFNLSRTVRRKQELMRWSGLVRSRPTISLPDLGTLRGLTGLRQGRGIDFKPFASFTRRAASAKNEYGFKPGFDLVWHVTPSLAATFTVNTDFADAEVDERQVNLGRFSLFFPEKRGFFTQDASLFTFGGIVDGVAAPFFSRRLGLADDGTKVDLLGGVKLTGRAGPLTIGLLDVQTDTHAGVSSRNLLVARAAVQVLAESSVGLIATNGDPRGATRNRSLGFDFNYRNSRLPAGKSLEAHAYAIGSDSARAGGRDTDLGLVFSYPGEPFEFVSDSRRIGARFDPALGFVPRAGIYELFNFASYTWRPEAHGVRRINLAVQPFWTLDLHGRSVSEDHDLPALEIENFAGDRLQSQYTLTRERLDAPFEISPGVVIPPGDYRWERGQVSFHTTRSRPVSGGVLFRDSGFYTGHRRDYRLSAEWRASDHFFASASWQLQQVRLPQGDFDVRLASARLVCTVSPDLQFSVLGQFDNVSHSLGVNFRVKWIVRPGNEVFLVVNEGYDTSDDRFRPVQNDTSLKAAWTFRF